MRAMQLLIWCCRLLLLQLATALTGDNVCNRTETSSEMIEYVVTEPVTYRLFTWCLKMPPRCSKYTTVMKERIKTKLQINNNTIDFCCDGYVQLETYCVPECNKTECPHMNCDSEKKCLCEAGFYGQRCHRSCRTGFWGENCANKCVCNGEPCNLINGDCTLTTLTSSVTTAYPKNGITTQNNLPLNESKELTKLLTTISLNKNQISHSLTTTSITPTRQHEKSEKTELSHEIEESDLDPTMIPMGGLDDMDASLLPEDEVIIVYPSAQTKSFSTTKYPQLKIPISSPVTTDTKKSMPKMHTEAVTKQQQPEKIKKLTTVDYYSKIHEIKLNKNKLTDLNPISTTEQTNIENNYNNNNNEKYMGKLNLNNKKYYSSTVLPIMKNIKYSSENLLPKKSNGLPPPVPDGFDNSLQIKNNNYKNNITVIEETDENNNIIIKTNDIQRDMEEFNNNKNNFSGPNTDTTVNSSLVKAKWSSALSVIDFSAPSIIISITGTAILFLALIVVIISHCKKSKSETTQSSFYDSAIKECHQENTIPYSGHYSSSGGQPIFFCPAFTNTYAFELAQELREAHYDHPRSARCLTNEPVYAELQY